MGAASWATARPGGFTPIEIETLLALVEPFSLLFEIKALDDMLGAVLSAYVGRDPARQILAGTVRRGDVRLMRAAMMLTDLRGFGELSDRQSPDMSWPPSTGCSMPSCRPSRRKAARC